MNGASRLALYAIVLADDGESSDRSASAAVAATLGTGERCHALVFGRAVEDAFARSIAGEGVAAVTVVEHSDLSVPCRPRSCFHWWRPPLRVLQFGAAIPHSYCRQAAQWARNWRLHSRLEWTATRSAVAPKFPSTRTRLSSSGPRSGAGWWSGCRPDSGPHSSSCGDLLGQRPLQASAPTFQSKE